MNKYESYLVIIIILLGAITDAVVMMSGMDIMTQYFYGALIGLVIVLDVISDNLEGDDDE